MIVEIILRLEKLLVAIHETSRIFYTTLLLTNNSPGTLSTLSQLARWFYAVSSIVGVSLMADSPVFRGVIEKSGQLIISSVKSQNQLSRNFVHAANLFFFRTCIPRSRLWCAILAVHLCMVVNLTTSADKAIISRLEKNKVRLHSSLVAFASSTTWCSHG